MKKEMRIYMEKMELLSPAGSYESAIAAIQNGCDALYMAGTRFSARAFADNFDNDKLREIILYAHAYGVKIYITLNTLIHDDEWEDCIAYIDILYHLNVDALIIQDLGILSYVRSHYADFEVHASTQMHIVNENAILFLKKLGVKRAVLAREVKLEEIKTFAKLGVELEVFAHGALCVAYSGQCLMSSMIGGRSGNRGACAQTCRMPYTLCDYDSLKEYGETAYLLSMKDLNTLAQLDKLAAANVTSLKIEGRMKKSEYVGYITSLYRKKLDDMHYQISAQELKTAQILFHRGYSEGLLMSQLGSHLVNATRPNHMGILIGEILSYHNGKAQVLLSDTLHQGDGIRILGKEEDHGFIVNRLYVQGLLVNQAKAKMMIEIECHKKVYKGSLIVKTSDPLLEKQIRSTYLHTNRVIYIKMKLTAANEKPLCLQVSDETNNISVCSDVKLTKAKQHPATKEDIIKQLNKVNNTIFAIQQIDIKLEDNLFIPVKMINQLRRDALDKLYEKRSLACFRKSIPYQLPNLSILSKPVIELNAKVLHEEGLLACLDEVDYVYVSDRLLYQKYSSNPKVKLCSNRVEKGNYKDVTMIEDIGGIFALDKFEADASLNVYNAYTMQFLQHYNASLITLSHELNVKDIQNLMEKYHAIEKHPCAVQYVAYGRVEVMVSEHCPINFVLLDNDKKHCQLCRNKNFALKDKFNNYFPMHNEQDCRMHLYDYKISDHIHDIGRVLATGVNAIRLDFTFETQSEIIQIIKKAKYEIQKQLPKRSK